MYYDLGFNTFDKLLTGIVGIMFDLGKVVFPILLGIAFRKKEPAKIIVFGLLLIFCLVNSFIASQGRDLNVSATYQAEADSQSTVKNNNEVAIKAKQKEIEAISSSINSMIDEKNKLPKNYITAKNNKQKEINNMNNKLSSLTNELKILTSMNYSGTGIVTKGLFQLAKYFSPAEPEKIIGKIAIVKNIMQEILAIAFLIGFSLLRKIEIEPEPKKEIEFNNNKDNDSNNHENNDNEEKKDGGSSLPQKNKKKFKIKRKLKEKNKTVAAENKTEKSTTIKHDKQVDGSENLIRFMEYIFDEIDKDNYCPGKRKIKEHLELTYREIDLIWEKLRQFKIIKLEKVNNITKTKAIKNREEALKIISRKEENI